MMVGSDDLAYPMDGVDDDEKHSWNQPTLVVTLRVMEPSEVFQGQLLPLPLPPPRWVVPQWREA
jgi:hypothetical protein